MSSDVLLWLKANLVRTVRKRSAEKSPQVEAIFRRAEDTIEGESAERTRLGP